MELQIAGLGIILYSPKHTEHIREGEDYFDSSYGSEEAVQRHIQAGTIVGFATGTPGRFVLDFLSGYPPEEVITSSQFKLRLGLHCAGGIVCVRDLYDLMDWEAACPEPQTIGLEDGFYLVTLCSDTPPSGILGDNQKIAVYLELVERFPDLAKEGIPTLCG